MWPFKKNPYKCRYIELLWEYPLPPGVPMKYRHRFTNKPQDYDRSMGNGGRGYACYDLDNKSDINLINRLNYGYKKNNENEMYISHDIVMLCNDIHKQRVVNNK